MVVLAFKGLDNIDARVVEKFMQGQDATSADICITLWLPVFIYAAQKIV